MTFYPLKNGITDTNSRSDSGFLSFSKVLLLLVGVGLFFSILPVRANDGDGANGNPYRQSIPRAVPAGDYYYNRVLSAILWQPEPGVPISRLEIHLSQCRLYGYQGDKLVLMTSVSTGREGHETKPGKYSVLNKDKDHKSSLYGSFCDAQGNVVDYMAAASQVPPPGLHYEAAPMPYYLRITDDGVGLHAGYVTGAPASHGCIRMPASFAEDLFSLVSVGTPVQVIQ